MNDPLACYVCPPCVYLKPDEENKNHQRIEKGELTRLLQFELKKPHFATPIFNASAIITNIIENRKRKPRARIGKTLA